VVVSDQSNPPVCRILDYAKLCYDQKRKQKSQKKRQIVQKLKELRFHVNTDEHDFQVKLAHAEEFLKKGYKVKLALIFRGREAAYHDQGFEMINRAVRLLEVFGHVEGEPVLAGKSILASLNPNLHQKIIKQKEA
jgi:translation initiation factor IF-3